MTMQRRPNNPIEKRKQQVRRHARNGLLCVGLGTGTGVMLGLVAGSSTLLILGFVVAVVGGIYNWMAIRKIINYRDS